MEEALSSFSSLPNDIVLNVLARVPRKYHPILRCVSKKLRSILRSSELYKTRSLMGKVDCFYVCFQELCYPSSTYHWFSLTENPRLISIPFPSPPEPYSTALMVGHDIYFVGGYSNHSRRMWILDSRSGKLRQGPKTLVANPYAPVGIVDEKIYMFGGFCDEKTIKAQVFDPTTQTWGVAANPSVVIKSISISAVIGTSMDRKVYVRDRNERVIIVYDPRDGNCEIIKLPDYKFFDKHGNDVCVIDNVLYIYHSKYIGLMWYNSMDKEWRMVHGLNLEKYYNNQWTLSMAEYNGKLVLLWHDTKKMEIWCSMISLHPNGVEVHGRVEWSDCVLSDAPNSFKIMHCLVRAD